MRAKLRNSENIFLDVKSTQNIIKFKSGISRFKSSESYMSNVDVITISNHDILIIAILKMN